MSCNFINDPGKIEAKSFSIIRHLTKLGASPEDQVKIRVIHASGDPELSGQIVFHRDPILAGITALRHKKPIIADVNMVRAGISRYEGEILVKIDDPGVKEAARCGQVTRAYQAFQELAGRMSGAVVVVGNAPTALFSLFDLISRQKVQPALIIGLPVGFVGAAEVKEMLLQFDLPCITLLGTKGGSSLAAAVVNALLKLVRED